MLEFTLDLKEIPVKLRKGDEVKEYSLREMTGLQRDQYLTELSRRMKMDATGKASIQSFDGLQADLLTRCLYDGETAITKVELQGYPSSVQSKLFAEAQKLNGLDLEENKEGNS